MTSSEPLSTKSGAADLAREHLALALDVSEPSAALDLARRLRPFFAVVKVGLELFVASGPPVVTELVAEGFAVFLDLKLHDIPNTVGRAAARAAALGARYVTVHAYGGEAMVRAAVAGFASASQDGGGILAVTVLTSEPVADRPLLRARAELAAEAGCAGLVCAASDLAQLAGLPSRLVRVVPGIRAPGSPPDDQARVATPREALSGGADLLVIGRTVTNAPDLEEAAAAVVADIGDLSSNLG